jgi:hypothetical protein
MQPSCYTAHAMQRYNHIAKYDISQLDFSIPKYSAVQLYVHSVEYSIVLIVRSVLRSQLCFSISDA